MQRFALLDKEVGETPLQCAENWRSKHPEYTDTPLAYAGRLDPMASGKLLVLIGEECKRQAEYHTLDKQYTFEVLLGIGSDTGDVLGLIHPKTTLSVTKDELRVYADKFIGDIELPYPVYSSKPVQGVPLHTWAVTGRLSEIEIPTRQSTVYKLACTKLQSVSKNAVYQTVTAKIETIPPVTDERKALGNDFRRPDIRAGWKGWYEDETTPTEFQVATFDCICSSGTYMRTLASEIGTALGGTALAYSIHRNIIGKYQPLPIFGGVWLRRF